MGHVQNALKYQLFIHATNRAFRIRCLRRSWSCPFWSFYFCALSVPRTLYPAENSRWLLRFRSMKMRRILKEQSLRLAGTLSSWEEIREVYTTFPELLIWWHHAFNPLYSRGLNTIFPSSIWRKKALDKNTLKLKIEKLCQPTLGYLLEKKKAPPADVWLPFGEKRQ